METVLRAVSKVRAPVVLEETDLHDVIASALSDAGIAYAREKRVGACRLDFLCQGGIAIEVKRGKPPRRLLVAQLSRYAGLSEVSGIVVASEAPVSLPASMAGKPVYNVALRGLWGVALP